MVKGGTEEEVAVRLVKAREESEPRVWPGLMALRGGGGRGREGGREGRREGWLARAWKREEGEEEEVAVRLVEAREERKPRVWPGLMALRRGGGGGGREGGREGWVGACVEGGRGGEGGGGGGGGEAGEKDREEKYLEWGEGGEGGREGGRERLIET